MLCQIEWAELFEWGVAFEFLEMYAQTEYEVIVPEDTGGGVELV
jgi:hypothetical protein